MKNLETIRKLRSFCGASIASCKKALEDSGGDFDAAVRALRKEGVEIARRKSSRETHAGVVDSYVHGDRRLGAIIVVKTETDFVARNEEFQSLAHEFAMQVAATSPKNIEEFLRQPFIKDPQKTVEDHMKEAISKFGENIEIIQFMRLEL
ncbi:elongation factor Ts [Patescibacteria group bacterium]|nr:elongation factor Ts [Patescibacteria group bacterium]